MAPDVSYIRDSPLAIIGYVLKDRADQVMEIWHLVFGESVFLVFMLRHKIMKSKFNRPAKLLISLGVR